MRSLRSLLFLALAACASSTEGADPAPRGPDGHDPKSEPPAAPAPPPAGSQPKLPDGLYPLRTDASPNELQDLAPLAPMLANASFVGLGESVHTTGGQYAAKGRAFRLLVEKLGFRVFAIESPHTKADKLARHLETCTGTAREALNGSVFGVFADDNLESLVDWMCAWNGTHPTDKISAFGFDAQQGATDVADLSAFIERFAAGDESTTLKNGLTTCVSVTDASNLGQRPYPGGSAAFDACNQGLAAVEQWLAANEASIVAGSSREAFELGKIAFVGLRSWEPEVFYMTSDYEKSSNPRDEAMAYIFEAIRSLRFPRAKVALWAHNIHLTARHSRVGAPYYDEPYKSMGEHLAEREGDEYAVVGVVSYEAEINWPGVGGGPVIAAEPNAVERMLHGIGEKGLIVDVSAYPPNGANLMVNSEPMVPAEQFRALLFVDHSPPMKALFW